LQMLDAVFDSVIGANQSASQERVGSCVIGVKGNRLPGFVYGFGTMTRHQKSVSKIDVHLGVGRQKLASFSQISKGLFCPFCF